MIRASVSVLPTYQYIVYPRLPAGKLAKGLCKNLAAVLGLCAKLGTLLQPIHFREILMWHPLQIALHLLSV